MDPTYTEERVGVAQLTLGMNSYRELCSLHFDYLTKTMIIEDVISAVSNDAANYAVTLVQQIKEAVMKDVQARYNFTVLRKNSMPLCKLILRNYFLHLVTFMTDLINIRTISM
jgi:exosome complex component RRP45